MHLHHDDRYADELRVEPQAWTAPRTWVTSELVTGTIMNTHVRDNLLAVGRFAYSSGAAQDVVSTAAETVVLTQSIGAGLMGTHGALEVDLLADYLNNSGATRTLRIKISFGGTVFYDSVDSNVPVDADRHAVRLRFVIANVNAANVNYLTGSWGFSSPVAADTDGVADLGATDDRSVTIGSNGTKAVDTALAQTLEVSVQHSASDANLSFNRRKWMIKIWPSPS